MVKERTKSIHLDTAKECIKDIVPPIHISTTYEFIDDTNSLRSDRGFPIKYSREENPTLRYLEKVISRLEEGDDSLAFSSGMAAYITALLYRALPGSEVVIPMESYSTTLQLLQDLSQKVGFKLIKVWPSSRGITESITRKTSLVIFEVMTNPTLKVIDLKEVCNSSPNPETIVIVDNTFTTPLLLKPLNYCARLVIHSTTKYLGGLNDVMGGAIVGSQNLINELWDWRRKLGTAQHPIEAYLTLRGIKTLELRFEKASENARTIAEFLSEHPKIDAVMYPGLKSDPYHEVAKKLFLRNLYGGVISFKLRGTLKDSSRFLKKLKIIRAAPSLGGAETMASIPVVSASKYIPPEERKKVGITESLVRLSVGLENVEDLIEDIDQALNP